MLVSFFFFFCFAFFSLLGASLVAWTVKNLLVVQETQGRSLGWEDPLEEGMEAHSSIIAWRISWTEEPGGLQSIGLQRGGHNILLDYPFRSIKHYHSHMLLNRLSLLQWT